MIARFHVPGVHAAGEVLSLPAEEADHLGRVLRLKPGDAVRVFDGRGKEFDATVQNVGKGSASVKVGQACQPVPEISVAITLAQAVLKADKMDDVVRDAVMMGVACIQPFVSTRAETSLSRLARGRKRERWERVAVASAKQSGRATVPSVLDAIDVETLFDRVGRMPLPTSALMLVEPRSSGAATTLHQTDVTAWAAATVIIGPEGGWTDGEIARGAAVARLITLGHRTLRADSVAVIALAALLARRGEF